MSSSAKSIKSARSVTKRFAKKLGSSRTATRLYAAAALLIVVILYNSFYGTMKNRKLSKGFPPRKPPPPPPHRGGPRREPFTRNFREKMRPRRRAAGNVTETLRNIFLF